MPKDNWQIESIITREGKANRRAWRKRTVCQHFSQISYFFKQTNSWVLLRSSIKKSKKSPEANCLLRAWAYKPSYTTFCIIFPGVTDSWWQFISSPRQSIGLMTAFWETRALNWSVWSCHLRKYMCIVRQKLCVYVCGGEPSPISIRDKIKKIKMIRRK